jgi:manganese catalase
VSAVFNGPHPETGEELTVAEVPHPIGAPAHDLPPQPAVFAPDYAPEKIREIAQKLREKAGLPKLVGESWPSNRRTSRRPPAPGREGTTG